MIVIKNTLKIDKLDIVLLSFYVIILLITIWQGISILTVGGFFMIAGAWLTYKGQIFWAIVVYLGADFCWVTHAYSSGDYQGVGFIFIGMVLGIMATWKMYRGKMDKVLRQEVG